MENEVVRTQFTFYESFYKAVSRIKKKSDRADAYETIILYALTSQEPDFSALPDSVAIAFELIRPHLDSARRKAINGKQGGAARKQAKANRSKMKQAEAKADDAEAMEADKQDKEKDKDKEQDKDKDKEQMLNPPTPFVDVEEAELSRLPATLRPVMGDWLEYKRQRKEKYTPAGLTALVSEMLNNGAKYGEGAVVEIVRTSMANGYKGIVFDRLKTAAPAKRPMNNPVSYNTDFAREAVARMMQEGG